MPKEPVVAVKLRPGVRSLTSVVSVLHARAARVAALEYSVRSAEACLLVRCAMSDDEVDLLARQLGRCVDVLAASIHTPSYPSTASVGSVCRNEGESCSLT
jgi:acetolactate synthase regulatory subunit